MERASKLSVSLLQFSSVQSLSRVRLFATLDCSTRGFPVYHQLPGLSKPIMSIDGDAIQASHLLSSPSPPAFNLVHWFCDAIQPSHLLSSPSPPAFNCSQHQGLFKWVTSLHQVVKLGVSVSTSVLPMNTQDWSPLEWSSWISLKSKGLSRVFSNTTVQKHQFFGAQLSSQSISHIHTWPQEKP